MADKKKEVSNKDLLNLLLELNHRLININKKIDELIVPSREQSIYVETELEHPIFIPEDVYLELCEEMGEDIFMFMGVS
tara:strand:+ start:479 stop:715 length:237 start_codon:yes stop_codon:yes gene_type:complete